MCCLSSAQTLNLADPLFSFCSTLAFYVMTLPPPTLTYPLKLAVSVYVCVPVRV